MPIIYRAARAEDLQRASQLVVCSINELSERHGFGPMATVRPPTFSLFSLSDDPHGLWVAEDANEILGFAFSWICGDLWFLAQLFVSPDQQGRGIGQELLRRTFEHALKANASARALITFAFNSVSQGLYIRYKLFPRCPIYNFSVDREDLIRGLSEEEELRCEPLANTPSHLDHLATIDACAFGGLTREASQLPDQRWIVARRVALRGRRVRRLCLCCRWSHRAVGGDAENRTWCCVQDGAESCRRRHLSTGVGVYPEFLRGGLERSRRA